MAEVCHSTSQNDQAGLVWIAVGCAVLGACLSLPFANDPGFERNKVFAVAFCAAILLAGLRLQRVSGLGMALALALAMSAFTALDPARALIGSLERSQGVLLLGALSVFALARLPWPVCRFWIAVAAFLSSIWALIQLAGMEPFVLALTWENSAWQNSEPNRVFAGFGNPTALGGFLAMALPVCAEMAKKGSRKSARVFGLIAGGLGVIALLASGTRAALLGLALAALFVYWLQRYKLQKPSNGMLMLGSCALGSLILVVILFSPQRSASVQHRLELWGDAGAAIASAAQSKVLLDAPFSVQLSGELPVERFIHARIWLGFGADLQSVPLAAARYRQHAEPGESGETRVNQTPISQTPISQTTDLRFSDRAHNLLLDSLLEFGVIGTALLLIWLLRGVLRLQSEPWRLCAALAGLLSWQAGFPLTAEKLVFVLVLCAVPINTLSSSSAAVAFYLPRIFSCALALALSVYCFGPWLVSSNMKLRTPEAAYHYFQAGTSAFKARQFAVAKQQYTQAVAADPWRIDLRMALAQAEDQLRASTP